MLTGLLVTSNVNESLFKLSFCSAYITYSPTEALNVTLKVRMIWPELLDLTSRGPYMTAEDGSEMFIVTFTLLSQLYPVMFISVPCSYESDGDSTTAVTISNISEADLFIVVSFSLTVYCPSCWSVGISQLAFTAPYLSAVRFLGNRLIMCVELKISKVTFTEMLNPVPFMSTVSSLM